MILEYYYLVCSLGSWKQSLIPETSFPSFHVFLTLLSYCLTFLLTHFLTYWLLWLPLKMKFINLSNIQLMETRLVSGFLFNPELFCIRPDWTYLKFSWISILEWEGTLLLNLSMDNISRCKHEKHSSSETETLLFFSSISRPTPKIRMRPILTNTTVQ